MNLKIEKKHNEPIIITEEGKVLGNIRNLVIWAEASEIDYLKVVFTFSDGTMRSLNNSVDKISLAMEFGGGYGLKTTERNIPVFSFNQTLLSRVQKFRYEISDQIFLKKEGTISKNSFFKSIRKVFTCAAYSNMILTEYCMGKIKPGDYSKSKDFTSDFSLYS